MYGAPHPRARRDPRPLIVMSDEKKKPNVRLFWLSALAVAVIFGIYRIVVTLVGNEELSPFWFSLMMWTYMIAGCALFIAVIVLQRGFSGRPVTADELPDEMSIPQKTAYINEDKRRKRIAKYLLIPLLALLFVFIFEIAEVYYFPAIKGWFENF